MPMPASTPRPPAVQPLARRVKSIDNKWRDPPAQITIPAGQVVDLLQHAFDDGLVDSLYIFLGVLRAEGRSPSDTCEYYGDLTQGRRSGVQEVGTRGQVHLACTCKQHRQKVLGPGVLLPLPSVLRAKALELLQPSTKQ